MLHDSDPVLLRGSRVDEEGVVVEVGRGCGRGRGEGGDMGSLVSSNTRGKSLMSAAHVDCDVTLAAQ